ncbi:MAG: ABC transporter substrate-binding protein [Anaerolineae bacterium]
MLRRLLPLLALVTMVALAACSQTPPAPAVQQAAATVQSAAPTVAAAAQAAAPTAAAAAKAAATAVAPAAPTAASAASAAGSGKNLVIARNFTGDVKSLDPGREYELTPPIVVGGAYERLFTIKPPDIKTLVPELAAEIPTTANGGISADGTVYTFKLKPGVKFASGNPLTSEDVKFSWLRMKNLKDNPSDLADIIKSIDAPDAQTVKVTLTEPNATFLSRLVSPNYAILDSKVVQSKGGTSADNAKDADKATDYLDQNSAGSGPYILKSWVRDQEIVMERNPNYWGAAKPAFDRIIIRNITDANAQRQLIEKGDADIATDLDPDTLKALANNPDVKVVKGNTLDTFYFALNTNPDVAGKELANPKVRQAIASAIDYDGLIGGLLNDSAVRPPSVIPLGLLGVDEAKGVGFKQDLDKAKALLKEAGYPDGFSMKLVYGAGGNALGLATNEVIASKLQADLARVGIKVELVPQDPTQRLADYRAGKLPSTISGWTPDYLDPDGWAVPFAVKTGSAAKRVFYDDPAAAQAAQDAAKTTDAAKRVELYGKVQQLMNQDVPFITLFQAVKPFAVRSNVQGFSYDPVLTLPVVPLSK